MKRTSADGFLVDANGAGRDGYKDTGPNPTTVDASDLNMIQEEIARAVELSGGTLNPANKEQLWAAIRANWASVASVTDNAIVRYDGTGGKTPQNSVVLIEDDGDVTGVKDVTITGEINYATPKTRVMLIQCGDMSGESSNASPSVPQWAFGATGLTAKGTAGSGGAFAYTPLNLPVGAVVTQIRMLIDPISRGDLNTVRILERSITGSAAPVTDTTYGPYAGITGGTRQWISSGTISATIAAGKWYQIFAEAYETGDILFALEITYSDPGPRNA